MTILSSAWSGPWRGFLLLPFVMRPVSLRCLFPCIGTQKGCLSEPTLLDPLGTKQRSFGWLANSSAVGLG
jgi:hypothetical protein